MIDSARLLKDLQRLLRSLEDDLRQRLEEHPELDAQVKAEYDRARGRGRTGQTYSVWRDEYLTQVAVHWILGAVFVRFLEDNEFLPEPWLSGPGKRLNLARDRHQAFFMANPAATDRDYLLASFEEVRRHPVTAALFDERHNPIYRLGPSADGARALVELLRKVDPDTAGLVHDFTDAARGTRFLGDLYQDLSESARKRFALLQTPEFVEEFILDRTLTPAIEEFGLSEVRLIDPACGSGHFLLGAFTRLLALWQRNEPGLNERDQAQKALDQVYGVDLNPFAVAIARFRLLIAALGASGVERLSDTPDFKMNLAAGDSLLHGPRPGSVVMHQQYLLGADPLLHVYETEDADELRRILGQSYHVIVGNPPYITPKDPALNDAYRHLFGSCYMKYSIAVPFTERFFDLALAPAPGNLSPAGFVGLITSNSFMKREFGKKLIEGYFPRWDLTHVIDSAGAYIPGHGTPTVILVGRNRPPVAHTVRTVMGIRGEPALPDVPAEGLVWTAILAQLDRAGSIGTYVSVSDLPRERLHSHPWSLAGGGASDLKERVELARRCCLGDISESIGITLFTLEDDAYLIPPEAARRRRL
ncbi:MAG: BREX-2 system adenine-specific DNA-methyltransferase PglX, partial [Thermoanaerobaculia bacterium]|nr:BREX-2 system adenine-specific DNA-methyltransferase PglX [Thermoanaerobaculia bacterium]